MMSNFKILIIESFTFVAICQVYDSSSVRTERVLNWSDTTPENTSLRERIQFTGLFYNVSFDKKLSEPGSVKNVGVDSKFVRSVDDEENEVDISFPFMAVIRWDDRLTLCTGSLISLWHVLTAGHCVIITDTGIQRQAKRLSVRLGSKSANKGGFVYQVRKWYVPSNYVRMTKSNDLAVLELRSSVELSDDVNLVPLASSVDTGFLATMVHQRSPCVKISWESASKAFLDLDIDQHQTKQKNNLQFTSVNFLTWDECIAETAGLKDRSFNHNTEVCTIHSKDTGVCEADSGGPLICDGKQFGVITKESGCGKSSRVDIMARVDAFYDFITDTMTRIELESRSNSDLLLVSGTGTNISSLCFICVMLRIIIIIT